MNALIVVDLQNDFCPGGSLAVKDGDKIASVINDLISKFEVVVASQDWHPSNHICFVTMHKSKKIGDSIMYDEIPQIIWPEHCVQNSNGAEFVKSLNKKKFSKIIQKGTNPSVDSYSAFRDNHHEHPTGLNKYLQGLGVNRVFITGLATDYCVKYTAMDAIDMGYDVFVVTDATKGVNLKDGDSDQALLELQSRGARLIVSSEVAKFL